MVLQAKRLRAFEGVNTTMPGAVRGAPLPVRPPAAAGDDLDDLLQGPRRRKIWDLSESLHCSIIGTCLSTGELRQLLVKLRTDGAETASDHDLHSKAVWCARSRDTAARLLNKALDKRHRIALHQFAKAKSDEAVGALWSDAVKRGDIPGAYWAALTHPAATEALIRRVFGDVHMLSHLVGTANRADIRRLHQLEQEQAALLAKIERQQTQLREAIMARDAKLRELSQELSRRIEAEAVGGARDAAPSQAAVLDTLIADMERRLSAESSRRERAERRLEQAVAARRDAEETCQQALQERDALREELAAAEVNLASLLGGGEGARSLDLNGLSVLYIGGRPNQVSHLRAASERASARFLHHDGGIDERSGLLPGLISRADVAMFPVDCISHEAALTVKRLCRQSGKPWIPLRTASVSAFLAAIEPLRSAASETASPALLA
ncbi:MAG: DUF2325 domain-containing protein [Stellaceae bacterium]